MRGVLVEGRLGDLGAEPDVVRDVEAVHAVLEVGEDLGLLGELPGPVDVGRERERVEVRRHVAGGAGIRVVPPGAADAVGLLVDRERLDAGPLQLDAHADAAEAGADDRDARRRRARRDPSGWPDGEALLHPADDLADDPLLPHGAEATASLDRPVKAMPAGHRPWEADPVSTWVFVYGTLMPGHLRWEVLAPHAAEHRPAQVSGMLWDTGRGWPALQVADDLIDVSGLDRRTVAGHLVRLADGAAARVLDTLDEIEGVDRGLYRRVLVGIDGTEAWTYETLEPTDGWGVIDRWTTQQER